MSIGEKKGKVKRMREITTTYYQAIDGTLYDTKEECFEAEKFFVPSENHGIHVYAFGGSDGMLKNETKSFFEDWSHSNFDSMLEYLLTKCDAIWFSNLEYLNWFKEIVLEDLQIDSEKFFADIPDRNESFMFYNKKHFKNINRFFKRTDKETFFVSVDEINQLSALVREWTVTLRLFQ